MATKACIYALCTYALGIYDFSFIIRNSLFDIRYSSPRRSNLIFNFSLLPSHHYICRDSITFVGKPLQISPFMQNKPNFLDAQMNVSSFITADYENIANWKVRKNKANTKPNKANKSQLKPIKCQNKPNTNPIQTQSNPICRGVASGEAGSKAKLQPCKLGLIKRIWCYKATVVFTKNNVKRNCFFIKSLQPVRKHCQSRDVDFLQHRALIHIRVAFRKVGTKLKAYVSGWPDGLFLG